MIKAMIVDDKTAAIELLRWRIHEHCPDITAVVSALSVAEALPLLQSFSPDILFLDIQLQRETGFDLLAKVKNWTFEVIFTTAFNGYAIQAIRLSALDYLLKPINGDDLKQALERFKVKKEFVVDSGELYRNFIQNLNRNDNDSLRLALPGNGETQYVLINNIVRLQAERNYTRLYFCDNKPFLSSKTLSEYEKLLRDVGFIRVHRSHLLNSAHITSFGKDEAIKLTDGSLVEVSRRKKELVEIQIRAAAKNGNTTRR